MIPTMGPFYSLWMNYTDQALLSLGEHPQMSLFQVSELSELLTIYPEFTGAGDGKRQEQSFRTTEGFSTFGKA